MKLRSQTAKLPRLAIACPGGVIPVARLRAAAELATVAGDGTLHIGSRQNMLVPIAKPFGSAHAFPGFKEALIEPDEFASPNIVSSAVAVGLGPGTSWLDEGVFLETLDELEGRPPFSVSLIDPRQSLVPAAMSFLTLAAAPVPYHWAPVFQLPGERTVMPCWIASDAIGELLRTIERAWRGAQTGIGEILEAVYQKMATHLPRAEAPPEFMRGPPHEYEGLHPLGAAGGWWLGSFNNDKPFPAQFIIELCVLAAQQGIGSVYLTPRRSLLLKHLRTEDLEAWRMLFARHGMALRHGENDLGWFLADADEHGLELKHRLAQKLAQDGFSRGGVEVGVGAMPFFTPGSFVICPDAASSGIASRLRPRSYALWARKDSKNSDDELQLLEKGLPESVLLAGLVQELQRRHISAAAPAPEPAVASAALPTLHQCSHCLTVYDAAVGDPTQGILPGTPFAMLDAAWACPVCEAPREAFSVLAADAVAQMMA